MKIGKIIFFVCISIIFLGIGAVFIYHNYQLRMESKLINNEGELVNFNNKNVNVHNEGSGKDTFVFMAGSGIAAPVYELKGLYSKFSKENKISVIYLLLLKHILKTFILLKVHLYIFLFLWE
ncbi:putative hydrolase [Bacillus mycoides FSL H7-687]|nr:putative hydrolase [Bacillus mycoides FSL H7-687]